MFFSLSVCLVHLCGYELHILHALKAQSYKEGPYRSRAAAIGMQLVMRPRTALPWARADGIILPLFAASHQKHDEPEDEHDRPPGEVKVDTHRLLVDCGVPAGDQSIDAHQAASDKEDEAKGDAYVESH